jgi:hypothetical protein
MERSSERGYALDLVRVLQVIFVVGVTVHLSVLVLPWAVVGCFAVFRGPAHTGLAKWPEYDELR